MASSSAVVRLRLVTPRPLAAGDHRAARSARDSGRAPGRRGSPPWRGRETPPGTRAANRLPAGHMALCVRAGRLYAQPVGRALPCTSDVAAPRLTIGGAAFFVDRDREDLSANLAK